MEFQGSCKRLRVAHIAMNTFVPEFPFVLFVKIIQDSSIVLRGISVKVVKQNCCVL